MTVSENKNAMEQRTLGKTGIRVSVLCYGCASAWARDLITDECAMRLFEMAYAGGITLFDTGHSYGKAEERIGMTLKNSSVVKRENIVLSTKFGTKIVNGKYVHDVSPDWMRKSVEMSLTRMGVDYIDLLYIHGTRLTDFTPELFAALEDLKRQGMIRATGASTFDSDVIKRIGEDGLLDVVMLDYNIIRRNREPEIDRLYEKGIGVIAGQAMGESVFLNDLFKVKGLKDLWYIARTMGRATSRRLYFEGRKYRFLNQAKDCQGSQIALKYVLDNPHIASASVSTCDPAHLQSNLDALKISIPPDTLRKIQSL